MFKIIVLLLFMLIMYAVLIKEKRSVRLIILTYFTLLSTVFMLGINRISNTFRLYDGPVLEGGFQSLSEWVGMFSFLYIIPTTFIFAFVLFRLTREKLKGTWGRISAYVVLLVVLVAMSYISLFIFTLIFYGFAP